MGGLLLTLADVHVGEHLVLTLAAGLSAALVLGYITHRLGLSPIVGYLLAGVLVGPNTPGFVADRELASQLALRPRPAAPSSDAALDDSAERPALPGPPASPPPG